jgi:hypothetical protein
MGKVEQTAACVHPIIKREPYTLELYKCHECGKIIFEEYKTIRHMIHVHPLNDIKDHNISDTGNTCHCEPICKIEFGKMIIVHNSFDGREGVEWANQIINQQ